MSASRQRTTKRQGGAKMYRIDSDSMPRVRVSERQPPARNDSIREGRGGRLLIKRLLDCFFAALLLALLAPVLLLLAIAVRVRLGSPILFGQVRPGLNGVPFRMYKFRTMTDARGPDGALLPDAERMTPFGRFLRETSLDELPELWNVLKGDMSFVGPRPLLVEYMALYSPQQARRHMVRPGITGWAQVNGRNALDWDTKLALDVWYVDCWSLALDLKVLAMTVLCVVARKDINAPGEATMSKFRGPRSPQ